MPSSTGTGLALLVLVLLLAGFGLWSIIRTPPQLLWAQSLVGRVNGFNNWMFEDSNGSELSASGKVLLRLIGVAFVVCAVVVLIIAIKLL